MIRILLFLVILAAALMLVTQITLSSDLPRRLLAAQMERTLGARMDVDSMKTSWNGRTRLTNLRLTMPLDEQPFLVVDEAIVDHTGVLMMAITRGISIDSMRFNGAKLEVIELASARWNLQRLMSQASSGGGGAAQAPRGPRQINLPSIDLPDATLSVVRASGERTIFNPVSFQGERASGLLWRFKAKVADIGSFSGSLATTGDLAHVVEFDVTDASRPIQLMAGDWNGPVHARGAWAGQITDGQLRGTLKLKQAQVLNFSGEGNAQLVQTAGGLRIEPAGLTVNLPVGESGTYRLTDGHIDINRSAIDVTGVRVARNGGAALLNGRYGFDQQANVAVRWRNLELAPNFRSTGTMEGRLERDWNGRLHIVTSGATEFATPSTSFVGRLNLDLRGAGWKSLVGMVSAENLRVKYGRRTYSTGRGSARLQCIDSLIVLDDLHFANGQVVDSSAGWDRENNTWWAWLDLDQVPLSDDRNVRVMFNAWGDRAFAHLDQLYLQGKLIELNAKGLYDTRDPHPLNLNVYLNRLPIIGGVEEQQQVLTTYLRGGARLRGTLEPRDLDFSAGLTAIDLQLDQRPLGDVSVRVEGKINEEKTTFESTRFKLLEGDWKVDGEIPINAGRPKIIISTENVNLAGAGEFLGQKRVSGSLRGQWVLTGPKLRELSIDGNVHIDHLAADTASGLEPLLADSVSARVTLARRRLDLKEIKALRHDGQITGNIHLMTRGDDRVHIQLQSEKWPIELDPYDMQLTLTGDGDLSINRTTGAIIGRANGSTNILLNDQPLGDVSIKASANGREVMVDGLKGTLMQASLNGRGMIDLDRPLNSFGTIEFENLSDEVLLARQPKFAGFKGTIKGNASIAPTTHQRALGASRFTIQADFDKGMYRQMEIKSARLVGYLDQNKLLLDRSPIEMAGGVAHVWARASRRDRGHLSSQVILEVDRLDLQQISLSINPGSDPLIGRVNGRTSVVGDPRKPLTLSGSGELNIVEADLIGSDIFAMLYSVSRFDMQATPAGFGDASFTFAGGNADLTMRYFDRGREVSLQTPIVDMFKLGEARLNGYAVASVRPFKSIELPFFADADAILHALQTNATVVAFDGTLNDPRPRSILFEEIGNDMRKLLIGEVREGRTAPGGG